MALAESEGMIALQSAGDVTSVINDDGQTAVVAELNLQCFAVGGVGAAVTPLPSNLRSHPDVIASISDGGAAVYVEETESRKNVKRFRVVRSDDVSVVLAAWTSDDVISNVGYLNSKERDLYDRDVKMKRLAALRLKQAQSSNNGNEGGSTVAGDAEAGADASATPSRQKVRELDTLFCNSHEIRLVKGKMVLHVPSGKTVPRTDSGKPFEMSDDTSIILDGIKERPGEIVNVFEMGKPNEAFEKTFTALISSGFTVAFENILDEDAVKLEQAAQRIALDADPTLSQAQLGQGNATFFNKRTCTPATFNEMPEELQWIWDLVKHVPAAKFPSETKVHKEEVAALERQSSMDFMRAPQRAPPRVPAPMRSKPGGGPSERDRVTRLLERQRMDIAQRSTAPVENKQADADQNEERVTFYLPDDLNADHDIVELVGVEATSRTISVKPADLWLYGREEEQGWGKFNQFEQLVEIPDRYCPIIYHLFCFKHHRMIQVFKVLSNGREMFRTLVYATDTSRSLLYIPRHVEASIDEAEQEQRNKRNAEKRVGKAMAEFATFFNAFETEKKDKMLSAEAETDLLRKSTIASTSCVILRTPPKLIAQAPDTCKLGYDDWLYSRHCAGHERYISQTLLGGLLPHHLVTTYSFYREERGKLERTMPDGEAKSHVSEDVANIAREAAQQEVLEEDQGDQSILVRGYPMVKDEIHRHILVSSKSFASTRTHAPTTRFTSTSTSFWLDRVRTHLNHICTCCLCVQIVHIKERRVDAFGGERKVCASVHKHYLDKLANEEDRVLINLLAGGKQMRTLANVLTRLEAMAHILVWSERPNPTARSREGQFGGNHVREHLPVDLVELPRLQLQFRTELHGDDVRLHSVELPHLHLYMPNGKWPDDVLRHVEDVRAPPDPRPHASALMVASHVAKRANAARISRVNAKHLTTALVLQTSCLGTSWRGHDVRDAAAASPCTKRSAERRRRWRTAA